MKTKWYLRHEDGRICGPFSEGRIKEGIQRGKIAEPMRIRQGESGWIRVDKVRRLFNSLQSEGIFVRDKRQQVFGPFTADRFKAMQRFERLPKIYWWRQGDGPWTLVDVRMANVILKPRQPMPRRRVTQNHATHNTAAALDETVVQPRSVSVPKTEKPAIPPAPVMKLRTTLWSQLMGATFGRVLSGLAAVQKVSGKAAMTPLAMAAESSPKL